MQPGLGEQDQTGCTSQYENQCSYVYSSIYLKRGLKQQHSWIQEQLKTSSAWNMQRS